MASLVVALLAGITSAEAVVLLEDSAGDQNVEGADAPVGWEQGDLLSLSIQEQVNGFWLDLNLAALSGTSEDVVVTGFEATVPFTFNDRSYTLTLQKTGDTVTQYLASLHLLEGGRSHLVHRADSLRDETIRVDTDTASLAAFVARSDLIDGELAPPTAGDSLVFGTVRSYVNTTGPDGGARATDEMTGTPDASYVVVLGKPVQDLLVTSDNHVRRTNGEATTFQVDVLVHNAGVAQRFVADVEDPASGWSVEVVPSTFELERGGKRTIRAFVTIPFVHEHGRTETADLILHGLEEPGVRGWLPLAVSYLETPQPAGHHDELWFHSRDTSDYTVRDLLEDIRPAYVQAPLYLNSLERDERDTREAVTGQVEGDAVLWLMALEPRLSIGLDLDKERSGRLEAVLGSTVPLAGVVDARLLLVGGDGTDETHQAPPLDGRRVQVLLESEGHSVQLDGQDIAVDLDLSTAVDQPLPYQAGTDLVLELRFRPEQPLAPFGPGLPMLQPGGSLRVPAQEFAETPADPALALVRASPTTREANPGDVLLWPLDVDKGVFSLYPYAHETAEVEILDSDPPHLVVRISEAANERDLVPVFVVASGPDGESVLRLYVRVVGAEVEDDARALESLRAGDHDTPPLGLLACLAVLVVFARRRKGSGSA